MPAYAYHPEAEGEYLPQVPYHSQIIEDLGLRFVTELETGITRARRFPHGFVSGSIGKRASAIRCVNVACGDRTMMSRRRPG